MSIKLKVSNIGEKNFYSTRAIECNINGRVIKTPIRALTYQEINAKAEVPDPIALNAEFSVIFKKLSAEEIKKIIETNEYPEKQVNFTEDYVSRMQHSPFTISFFQPSRAAMQEFKFDKDKYLRITSEIQKETGLKFISFPWLDYKSSELTKKYSEFDQYCGNDSEPVFVLDMCSKPSELEIILAYLNNLVSTGRIHFIGILYQRKRNALASYDLIWNKLKELQLGIILLDVPREEMGNLSASHIQEFVLGDIIALTSIKGFGKKLEDAHKKLIGERIKMFNTPNLKLESISTLNKSNKSWADRVSDSFSDNSEIKNALNNYSEAENDADKEKVLRAISKTHEFMNSSNEFKSSRKYILKNEVDYYLSTKQDLLNNLKIEKKGKAK